MYMSIKKTNYSIAYNDIIKSKLLFIHYRKQKATIEWQKRESESKMIETT